MRIKILLLLIWPTITLLAQNADQPVVASNIEPCSHNLADLCVTEFIATVESGLTFIANGKLLAIKDNRDGTVTFHYHSASAYPVYLTAFVADSYAKYRGALVLRMLCKELGDEAFFKSIQAFIKEKAFKPATTQLPNYQVATLIVHEVKDGCFAIINWWVDENMLPLFAYLASPENPHQFQLISDKGLVSCVWEMAVLWFERNAWVEEVLKHPKDSQAFDNYLTKYTKANL